jgi:hypothetical protein
MKKSIISDLNECQYITFLHGPIVDQQININTAKRKPKFSDKCYYLANKFESIDQTNDNLYFEIILMLNQSFVNEYWHQTSYEYLTLLSKLKKFINDSLNSNQIDGLQNLEILNIKPSDEFIILTSYLTIRKNNQYLISSSMIESLINNHKMGLLNIYKAKVKQIISSKYDDLKINKDIINITNNDSKTTQIPFVSSINSTNTTKYANTTFVIDLIIDENFTFNLLNKSSDDYLNLEMKLKKFIQNGLNQTGLKGYQDLFILNVTNGSINIRSILIYQYYIESPVDSLLILQALKSNNQNYLPVRLDSIKIRDLTKGLFSLI